jgi:hypothetical protein
MTMKPMSVAILYTIGVFEGEEEVYAGYQRRDGDNQIALSILWEKPDGGQGFTLETDGNIPVRAQEKIREGLLKTEKDSPGWTMVNGTFRPIAFRETPEYLDDALRFRRVIARDWLSALDDPQVCDDCDEDVVTMLPRILPDCGTVEKTREVLRALAEEEWG